MSGEISQTQARWLNTMYDKYQNFIDTCKPVWELEVAKTDFNSVRLQLYNNINGEIRQINLTNEQINILNQLDLFSEANKELLVSLLKKVEAEEDNT